ncbi:PepSY-associated TM helix domain-containing protein [Maribacter sp. PR1]|uniref:PepSY-associated TM helix domain-containing protein n=1 Tax=Maribacter cobaltidurans TaxID=1178778 RepID=A0ABU7IUS3_9FLAO|nr:MULTISPECIES: PepSY-associated TM helix domain-containing protein [Maribacter]MDC6389334.1 PepSY-associated TM helix domain-containing protein [Maribacter sp. PR1]MEE1976722.1 PepSY-associated TM helix domain-containing protein [Maribacter cobaltidurans]
MKGYTFRKLLNDLHLWLGLGSGIILFLVCLSGTLLTFEDEIKELFLEEIVVQPVEGKKQSIAELKSSLEKEGIVSSVTIRADIHEPYQFSVKTDPKQRRGTTFFVDPYSGEYRQKQKSSLDGFFMSMFRMHRWLLLDSKIGRPIVGVATLIFLFLAISGLYLWFPKKLKWKKIKPGFKIKFSANWKRINHDLHNTLGFYACIFLVIMTLTGLCWSFEWYRDVSSSVLGTKVFGGRGGGPKFESQVIESNKELTAEQVLQITQNEFNYEGDVSLFFLTSDSDIYHITKRKSKAISPVISNKLVLDRDGSVLNKEIFTDKPLNVQIASLIKPIHTGQIFGTFSKIIYFVACLIATSLPITGTLIWWNKLNKKKKKVKK